MKLIEQIEFYNHEYYRLRLQYMKIANKSVPKELLEEKFKQLIDIRSELTKIEMYLQTETAKLQYNSIFKIKKLAAIIVKLIHIYEGEQYTCQFSKHYTYKSKIGTKTSLKENNIVIIIKTKYLQTTYTDPNIEENIIDSLIESSNAIVLSEIDANMLFLDYISIYNVFNYPKQDIIKCNIELEKFPYIKDFLNDVIEYKYINHKAALSTSELLILLKNFITYRKAEIEQNYQDKYPQKADILVKKLKQEINN